MSIACQMNFSRIANGDISYSSARHPSAQSTQRLAAKSPRIHLEMRLQSQHPMDSSLLYCLAVLMALASFMADGGTCVPVQMVGLDADNLRESLRKLFVSEFSALKF
ncbi:hypothetical protein BIW11_09300 [Tropilaelaps mercedesae]|uniref:Uncharacterized protein n=1 Tax=Tropilaelaps mercedesae TaxID=418985 RepID=A0A1V9XKV0_9ACAR|nr:hypothetical protein BIW11_09300 [Tropilaelaps mercedesae]